MRLSARLRVVTIGRLVRGASTERFPLHKGDSYEARAVRQGSGAAAARRPSPWRSHAPPRSLKALSTHTIASTVNTYASI